MNRMAALANLCEPMPIIVGFPRSESLRNEFYQTAIEMETWHDFHISSEDFHKQLLEIEPFTIKEVAGFLPLICRSVQ